MSMKLFLNKFLFLFLFLIFCLKTSLVYGLNAEYNVSSSGIKIGYFSWSININNEAYETEINLKNSGILSSLFKFNGNYTAKGIVKNNIFQTKEYKQFWKTRKKTKIVNMYFDNYLTELIQEPKEVEFARINLEELYLYFDPITSFINILNGNNEVKTIDGRRVYTLKKEKSAEDKKIVLKVENYKNIWADHKRNDLKKIEFYLDGDFLPSKILIHFKERLFKLEKF